MNDTQDLEKLLDEINQTAEEMRNKKIEVKDSELPSNLNIMLSGITDSKAINFLFSHNIDQIIEKLLTLADSGDIEKILSSEETLKQLFKVAGFGEGAFSGTISRTVISSIKSSINSQKFTSIKSKMQKIVLVVKNLERAKNNLSTSAEKEKYSQAVFAIKRIFRFVSKIYKNRRIINNKVVAGLNSIVNESKENEMLEALE